MARSFYVPLVYVDIAPNPNANIAAIEKTTRTVSAPVYAVPLYKAKWGKAAKITTRPLLAELNPYHQVLVKDDEEAADNEIERLKRHFNTVKRDVFHEVYTDELFRERFHAAAKATNPWLEAVESAQAKAEEAATGEAADKLVEAAARAQANKAKARVKAEQRDTGAMQREIDAASKEALAEAEAESEIADASETDELPAPEPEIPRRGAGRPKREKQPAPA